MNDRPEDAAEGARAESSSGFSPLVGACFTLNYIMGVGFITLPYAFHEAGIILSTFVMTLVCVAAKAGSDYVLSAMARADHAVSHMENQEGKERRASVPPADSVCDDGPDGKEGSSLMGSVHSGTAENEDGRDGRASPDAEESGKRGRSESPSQPALLRDDGGRRSGVARVHVDEDGHLLVGNRRFDVPELCHIFLGDAGFLAYNLVNGLHLYSLLWVFTSVFAHSLDRALPLFGANGGDSYPMWVLIFAAIAVPMSLMELSEQVVVQVILSWCRFIVSFLMVVTPIVAALHADRVATTVDIYDNEVIVGNPHFGNQLEPAGAPLFRFSGIHRMFPIVSLTTVFHHSVPALADEIRDKSQVGHVFGLTMFLCGAVYSLIGGIGAWYFGEGVEESGNLNWDEYHAGTGHAELDHNNEWRRVDVAWWAKSVSLYVVLFPAIDVISAFPLNAFCLANCLLSAFFGDDIHVFKHETRIATMFRLFACIIPLLGALFVRNLGRIASFTGLMGLAIQFCFPALLYISSGGKLTRMGLRTQTHYDRLGSSTRAAIAVFVLGAFSILLVFLTFCIYG